MPDALPHLEFRLDDGTADGRHVVPADALADVLKHAQRAVHLLAMASEGREVRQRARVPTDIARRFTLLCELPGPGSYVQPVVLMDTTHGLFGTPEGAAVLDTFKAVGAAISDARWDDVRTTVPDRALRLRVLDEFVGMMPEPDERWAVEIRNAAGTLALFDARRTREARAFLRHARSPAAPHAVPYTVTGELIRIDFAQNKLTIRHHPTQRALDCEYAEDLEEMLLENRRDWIQVTGLVELDEQDRPVRLTGAFDIQDVDLSPILVDHAAHGGRRLRFIGSAVSFQPALDETGELLVIEAPALGVHVFAPTREALIAELNEQLVMLWTEYEEAGADELTDEAAVLGQALRDQLEPVSADAAPAA